MMELVTIILTALPVIISVVGGAFGVKYKKWKDWFKKAYELLEVLDESLQDENTTKKEAAEISKKLKKLLK